MNTTSNLKEKLAALKELQTCLDAVPDASPVVAEVARTPTDSNVFGFEPANPLFLTLCQNEIEGRNRTYRSRFTQYATHLFSVLADAEVVQNAIRRESQGAPLSSKSLRRVNRNYAEFNRLLIKVGLLDQLERYDAEHGKCCRYALPIDLLKKGVVRRYLSMGEKAALIDRLPRYSGRDKSRLGQYAELHYIHSLLRDVTVDKSDFESRPISVSRFQRSYPLVQRIRSGKHDLHLGGDEGRLYGCYLHLPKEVRELLRWKGTPLVEGDIAASHFHFFLHEMTDAGERSKLEGDLLAADPYVAMCGNPAGVDRQTLKQSSHVFKYGNRNIAHSGGWSWSSPQLPYRRQTFYNLLSKRYPRFSDMMARKKISHAKHRHDYACSIMRQEAQVVVHLAGEECRKQGLVYLPVHDGFLTVDSGFDAVCDILRQCFRKTTGSTPLIRKK